MKGAYAHVCALPERDAALRFDEPEVQHARRDALASWIPLLGDALVCLTTFALDASRLRRRDHRGARARTPSPTTRSRGSSRARSCEPIFSAEVPPPPGPVIERYAGVPWPGGGF